MSSKLHQFLSSQTPESLLSYYQKFRGFLREKNINNGGQGSFQKLISKSGKQPSNLEKDLVILGTKYGDQLIGKRSKKPRQEILNRIGTLSEDCTDKKPEPKHHYAVKQAGDNIAGAIDAVCRMWGYTFNFQQDRFELNISDGFERFYFNCYYWFENIERNVREVKTGVLTLSCSEPEHNNYRLVGAELLINSNESIQKLVSKEMKREGEIVYAYFTNEYDKQIITSININVGKVLPVDWRYMTGTYTTVGPGVSTIPIVGLMILEQISKTAETVVAPTTQIEPTIHHFLHRTRLFALPSVFRSLGSLPTDRETKLLNKYVGAYEGIYYRKAKAKFNNNENRIDHFLLDIKANGEASITMPNMLENYLGRVRVLRSKNDALIGYFDFLVKESTYRFTIYFNKEFKGKSKDVLVAVYAGIEREDPYTPTAGRMVFRKLAKETTSEVKAAIIRSDQSIEEFKQESDTYLSDILSGLNEDYDYIEQMPLNFAAVKNYKAPSFPYTGTFYTYYLSTKQGRIYKTPIRIHKDGTVEMRTREPNNVKTVHKGTAIYNGSDRLSLYMENAFHEASYFHLLFAMGNISNTAGTHFFGVSSKFDKHGSPSGRVEVLLKDEFPFENSSSESFVIGSQEFKTENTNRKNLLTYLVGRSNRILVSKSTVNADFVRANRHEEFFFASCYVSKKAKTRKEFEKALKYLYQAWLHGFGEDSNDISMLKVELEDSFANLKSKPYTSRPDHSELESLSFEQLQLLIMAYELIPGDE